MPHHPQLRAGATLLVATAAAPWPAGSVPVPVPVKRGRLPTVVHAPGKPHDPYPFAGGHRWRLTMVAGGERRLVEAKGSCQGGRLRIAVANAATKERRGRAATRMLIPPIQAKGCNFEMSSMAAEKFIYKSLTLLNIDQKITSNDFRRQPNIFLSRQRLTLRSGVPITWLPVSRSHLKSCLRQKAPPCGRRTSRHLFTRRETQDRRMCENP